MDRVDRYQQKTVYKLLFQEQLLYFTMPCVDNRRYISKNKQKGIKGKVAGCFLERYTTGGGGIAIKKGVCVREQTEMASR